MAMIQEKLQKDYEATHKKSQKTLINMTSHLKTCQMIYQEFYSR